MVLTALIAALWVLLPAYAANGSAPLSVKIKKTHPMDFNKKIKGKRIFGDGKTWEGFLIGMICGVGVGLIVSYFNPAFTLPIIFLIPLATLIGDAIGSFIKRQLNMKRGGKAPLLDQLDFIIAVIFFTYAFIEYSLLTIAFMIVITYFIHRITSVIGFKMKIKKEPW